MLHHMQNPKWPLGAQKWQMERCLHLGFGCFGRGEWEWEWGKNRKKIMWEKVANWPTRNPTIDVKNLYVSIDDQCSLFSRYHKHQLQPNWAQEFQIFHKNASNCLICTIPLSLPHISCFFNSFWWKVNLLTSFWWNPCMKLTDPQAAGNIQTFAITQ